ncbi:MAG: hypothetical protein IPK78_20145 [Rhodospirillales bacterium]|nr:hypothetical protein [Rhodospirillales bacterium]
MTDRVGGRHGDDQRQGSARHLAATGLHVAGAQRLQSPLGHQVAARHRLQLRAAGPEAEHDALGGVAWIDGDEVADQ